MKLLFVSLSIATFCLRATAATDPDVIAYSIPADAVKVGPLPGPPSSTDDKLYAYVPLGTVIQPYAEPPRDKILAYEEYSDGILYARQLFKQGRPHGIQRSWNSQGQIMTEEPYKDGLMDGTFRYWNDKHQLVSQYEMVAGAGTQRSYDDDGRLTKEIEIENNVRSGRLVTLEDRRLSIMSFKGGQFTGTSFHIDENRVISSIRWAGGPSISYDSEGNVKWKG